MKNHITLGGLALLAWFIAAPASANDAVAGVAGGGIVLQKSEDISMEQEDLTISPDKVVVEYLFRNTSEKDILTEVAFPLPFFKAGEGFETLPDFSDFLVEVDGHKVQHRKEVKALFDESGQTDYSSLLREFGLDPEAFGGWLTGTDGRTWERLHALSQEKSAKLQALGLIDQVMEPRWGLKITLHWPQSFPAGKTIRIRHIYTPVTSNQSGPGSATVHYILTSANTWKGPIKRFHLTILEPGDKRAIVDGEVGLRRTGANKQEAAISDFIPSTDITVRFIPDGAKGAPNAPRQENP